MPRRVFLVVTKCQHTASVDGCEACEALEELDARLLLSPHFSADTYGVEVLETAEEAVRFCYSDDGMWIGTEHIRANGTFINIMRALGTYLKIFLPLPK